MRLRVAAISTMAGLVSLAGCAPPALQQAAGPPNPYGYLQPSGSCVMPTVHLPAAGNASTTLRMVTDTGYCAFHLQKAGGGPFASFLVIAGPAHGKPLNYNYDGSSVITYTPNPGYVGPDDMSVQLVPDAGGPRVTLNIAITVTAAASQAHAAKS